MQKYTIQNEISLILEQLTPCYGEREAQALANRIFDHLMDYRPVDVYMNKDQVVTEHVHTKIRSVIHELKRYRPVQYIFRETWFYNLSFYVDESVLIPRPETEELVQWVLNENRHKTLSILDIGTGSGCIAVSLAKNMLQCKVWAMDVSDEILEIAMNNADRNQTQIRTIKADILDIPKHKEAFDLIVSNPPYIPGKEKHYMPENVKSYEPSRALFVPDQDPLVFYRAIADFGKKHLKNGGSIYCELHENMSRKTKTVFESEGYAKVIVKQDINGKSRMLRALKE